MTTSIIGRVLCRIAAVYFLVQAAQGLSFVIPYAFDDYADAALFTVSVLLAIGAPLLCAFVLWKFADRIASVGDTAAEKSVSTDLTQDDILEAGIILIGVAAILFGIVDAIRTELADLWYRLSRDEEQLFLDQTLIQHWTLRLGYLFQLFLGFALVYGRQSIIEYIHRARRIGSGGA
jgi:hypothetical protein